VPTATEVTSTTQLRHSLLARVTHLLTFLAFIALLITGIEILISHPRFYWGEVGNVNTTPLFTFHIPSSRDTVPTGYGYVLPDENGWSRYLHFEAAWLLVLTGAVYGIAGFWSGHFRKDLWPARGERSFGAYWRALRGVKDRDGVRTYNSARSYNPVQRTVYLAVIFLLFPAVIWTGLAVS